jgi:predicted MFS family arabinose efflux permease
MGLLPYGEHEIKPGGLRLEVRGLSFKEAIHTRQFWLLCAIYFGSWFALNPILVHIVIHATGLEISAASAAFILAIIGGAKIAGSVIMGSVADRIGNKIALIINLILMSMTLILKLIALIAP